MEVMVKGKGKGREYNISDMKEEGLRINKINDVNKINNKGCSKKKKSRV